MKTAARNQNSPGVSIPPKHEFWSGQNPAISGQQDFERHKEEKSIRPESGHIRTRFLDQKVLALSPEQKINPFLNPAKIFTSPFMQYKRIRPNPAKADKVLHKLHNFQSPRSLPWTGQPCD